MGNLKTSLYKQQHTAIRPPSHLFLLRMGTSCLTSAACGQYHYTHTYKYTQTHAHAHTHAHTYTLSTVIFSYYYDSCGVQQIRTCLRQIYMTHDPFSYILHYEHVDNISGILHTYIHTYIQTCTSTASIIQIYWKLGSLIVTTTATTFVPLFSYICL